MDPYDDDEDVSHGDIFDHLSPRDISLSRYKQNHDWMDEILSSPYRVQQIMMADLNLGLKGELAPLTQNIFEAQTEDALTRAPKNAYVGRLDKGLAEEFAKRCSDKTAALQTEIEQLRVNHEKAVADFSKRSLLRIAENDLRNTVPDTGSEFWRLEGREEANSESEDEMPAPPKKVQSKEIDDILAEVVAHIGQKPLAVQLVDRIQIGGFQEPVPEPELVEPSPPEQAPQSTAPVLAQRSSGVNSPGSAGMAGRVDDRHVQDQVEVQVGHVIGHVGGEAEEQVLALIDDLIDTGVGTVGLVDQEDHGQVRLKCLAQHEAGLRQRAL